MHTNHDRVAFEKKWEGRWDQLVGRVKSLWGDLSDDPILQSKGEYQALIGRIKEKTGESLQEIEEKLNAEDE